MRWTSLSLLILCLVIPFLGCGKTNVGALWPPYGQEDPGDEGWSPDPGGGGTNGSYLLRGLEPGSVFVNGAPNIEAVYPGDGAVDVDRDTFVAFRFNESMNPDTTLLNDYFEMVRVLNQKVVTGTFSFAPGSANRIVIFEPDDTLEPLKEYEVTLSDGFQDAQGSSYGGGDVTVSFTTVGISAKPDFAIIPSLTLPVENATGVYDGASVLLFFTVGVNTAGSGTGMGEGSGNFTLTTEDGDSVQGSVAFYNGDRVFVMTPALPYPGGKRLDGLVNSKVTRADESESLDSDYTFSFTTVDFPRVTAITFPGQNPLITLPANAFLGRVNLTNQHTVDLAVTLSGSGNAGKLTLIFWDNNANAVIVIPSGPFDEGLHEFTVDLKPGTGDAILDGTITVGAFTTSAGENSPVGPPLALPDLLKDTVMPSLLTLGPPNDVKSGHWDMLSDAAMPAFYGRASEDLADLTMTVEFFGTALDPVKAIKFFSTENPAGSGIYSEEVTRGSDHLFITEPFLDFSTGGLFSGIELYGSGSRTGGGHGGGPHRPGG